MTTARVQRAPNACDAFPDACTLTSPRRWPALARAAAVLAGGTLVAMLLVALLVVSTEPWRWRLASTDLVRIEADGAVRGADVIDAVAAPNRSIDLTDEQFAATVDYGLAVIRVSLYPRYTDDEWTVYQRGFQRGAKGRYQFLRRTQR